MAMGVAFILSALFVKYRDIGLSGGDLWLQLVCMQVNHLFHRTYLLQRNQTFCCAKVLMLNQSLSDFTGYASFIIDQLT